MLLLLWYEATPYVLKRSGPTIRTGCEDVVWQNVVVAICGHDWNHKAVKRILWIDLPRFAEHSYELIYHISVEFLNLPVVTRQPFIIVVSRRIPGPYHEIDVVFDVFLNPVECRVDQREGRIALGLGSTEVACVAFSRLPMARMISVWVGVGLVEGIGMEICRGSANH